MCAPDPMMTITFTIIIIIGCVRTWWETGTFAG
jgi:hypothetical protein